VASGRGWCKGYGSRRWALLLSLWQLPGCTLLGAGIGAGVDSAIPGPYEMHPVGERVPLNHGDRIRVVRNNGLSVEGKYLAFRGPSSEELDNSLLIEVGDAVVRLPCSDIETIGVEVTGKGWLYGGLVGLAVDVTLVVAVGIAMHNSFGALEFPDGGVYE
jgi:hypothetical protein